MALLPVAVKSTSDSVGDTLATDAANSVIAQLDRAAWENFEWIRSLPTTKPSADSKAKEYAGTTLGADESYKIEPASGLQNGHFVFLFGPPGEVADFAAEVICWRENINSLKLTSLDSNTGKAKQINMNTIRYPSDTGKSGDPYVRVFIEISWPITKSYKKTSGSNTVYPRQSRLFVREYLDPAYYKPVN